MKKNINIIIDDLKQDPAFINQVSFLKEIPEQAAKYIDFPEDLSPLLRQGLEKRGISRLYSHQRKAYDAMRQGSHVVLVTPTASGKTLSYNLPVLQNLLEDNNARAMYLFPTKALSQDQQSELNDTVLSGELPLKIFTYDGDTPQSIRMSARDEGRIVITNPDMLHSGILPNHPRWIKFLKALKYIVIDEVHIYRGVFGSHFTNVIRRLKRITRFYGTEPQFFCASATIGNPRDLAEKIIEEKSVLIDENGAPRGRRYFMLYNPPLVDAVQGIRRGVVLESQRIAAQLLKSGVKTIVFARSRVRTELIASYIRDNLKNFYNDNHHIKIASYRGGYLPSERRAIEKGLRDGSIQGVVSTNALELGIDIGGLDASVMAGFPGSISSAWQQAGRAGRSTETSLTILVASASPLDQYLMNHPEYFFGKSPESGWIDPDNIFILMDQLKCALFELPMDEKELTRWQVGELLTYLEEMGVIRYTGGKWYWSERTYPAENVSLRSSSQQNVIIINTSKGKNNVIGEMDVPSAKTLIYQHAVYLHGGEQFLVKELDLEKLKCYVEEAEVNYYTDSVVKTDIKILHKDQEIREANYLSLIGDILVRSKASKFKKLKFKTHENIGFGEIFLPAEEMHTRSVALIFDRDSLGGQALARFPEEEQGKIIRRMGTLIRNVAPLFLLCDINDLGIAERVRDPQLEEPCLYIYDTYAGGTGLAEGFLSNSKAILQGTLDLIARCSCTFGCPSCIGAMDSDDAEDIKQRVTDFLEALDLDHDE
ncbi:MAG: DEAD/DEAH box helicase [Spirochaetales bacterium]|nr:DEAD/DEAH box helicase [Spirochaetales bacterium]